MIQPIFKLHQKVYSVMVGRYESRVQCPDCLGQREWKVILPSGEEFQHDCQTCRGGYYSDGCVTNYGDEYRISEVTIGSIRIDTADRDAPITYMCLETGVGSGSVYKEKEMFSNREEAELWGKFRLEEVKGLRQVQELESRKRNKKDSLIHGKRKKSK